MFAAHTNVVYIQLTWNALCVSKIENAESVGNESLVQVLHWG